MMRRFLRVLAFAPLLGLIQPIPARAAGQFSMTCLTVPPEGFTVPLDGAIPITTGFTNPSNAAVTLTVTVRPNPFLPAFAISQYLEAGLSRRFSEPLVQALPQSSDAPGGPPNFAPLAQAHVIFDLRSSATGEAVQQSCDYLVTTVLPSKLQDGITVPVRWCVLEGSFQAGGKPAGEMVDGGSLIGLLEKATDHIWLPSAHIAFRSAYAPDGIPVIATPLSGDPLQKSGEVDLLRRQESQVAFDCDDAWQHNHGAVYSVQRGIPVVNVGAYINGPGNVLGVASSPNYGLWTSQANTLTGKRGDDLCGQPRHLSVMDVSAGFATVLDQQRLGYHPGAISASDPAAVLAHELGHALTLGHGNGVDDDHNGLTPAGDGLSLMDNPGPRRYDTYCDPRGVNAVGVPVEDVPFSGPFNGRCDDPTGPSSLMDERTVCSDSFPSKLWPLQVEQARAAADLWPGRQLVAADPAPPRIGALAARFRCGAPPCGVPPEVLITRAELSAMPDRQMTAIAVTVWGPIPQDASARYLAFMDLDNNPATGCSPAALGLPTSMLGVELVTSVAVAFVNGVRQVTPTVWQCQNGAFVEAKDQRILTQVYNQVGTTSGAAAFGQVLIELPDAMRGPVGALVRIQAVAQQLSAGGVIDRLPAELGNGGVISLVPPTLPQCTVTPVFVVPGAALTVTASGLPPNQSAEVDLGAQPVATGPIDSNGGVQISLIVPANAAPDLHPVTVLARGTAATAACAVNVVGPARPPAITAPVLGAWHLNDGIGSVAADTSGSGNQGQLVGAPPPTWITDSSTGITGLRFQGQQYVDVPAATVLEPPTVTVAAWVRSGRPPATPPAPQPFGYILSKGAADCQAGSYALYTGSTGGLFFYIRNAQRGQGALNISPGAAPAAIWDGGWHQVVGTYDGQYIRLYVDRVEVGSGTLEPGSIQYHPLLGTSGLPATVSTDDLTLGMFLGTCRPAFSGDITDVRIWGGALTPAQIGALPQKPAL